MANKVFEIGLTLAGAISAGAYTAGVMDFLFEALDEYEAARKSPDWDGPRHEVRVPVMTGASAGGMTSAISALHAFHELDHVRPGAPAPKPERNRLYSSWVTDISIERLLETKDLDGPRQQNGVLSLFCCDVLDEIVESAFSLAPGVKARDWIGRGADRGLRVMATLTNVRGVPYSFPIFGGDSPERFGMLNHGDYYDFLIGVGAPPPPPAACVTGPTPLDAGDLGAAEWAVFKTVALATGAFPVGLRPRLISRPDTSWFSTNGVVGYDDPATGTFVNIPPDANFREAPYAYVSVDGGTIDNEPLELARRFLSGGAALRNDPNGEAASKAVILIAPFPSLVKSPPDDSGMRLTHLLPLIGSALIDQARFKPEELQKAANDAFFSRYMISPTRENNGSDAAKKYPIACGALGGFSGFLHESFRRHDYLLGRRNAQAFLRWNFSLPTTNPLFDGVAINRDRWIVRDAGGQTGSVDVGADRTFDAKRFAPRTDAAATAEGFPIIPLSEKLCQPIDIGAADMPRPDLVSIDDLTMRIGQRAMAVADTMVNVDLRGFTKNMWRIEFEFLKLGARAFGAHVATDAATGQVQAALNELKEAFA
ncbi:patatin-like phospholipase family protein [Rhodoblastus sp.]|uniref:patatin-like phospholipase family protein n=1 Tax=Rhodoblastus sp. TaxID=1962975 RepID=UPI003F955E12